jgi:flagella basal body P-ring formation protein FlgA
MRFQSATSILLVLIGPLSAAAKTDRAAAPIGINGPRVRLVDLLPGAGDDVDLGPAPSPGSTRRIYRSAVLAALPPGFSRRLPNHFTVRTRKQELSCTQLVERVVQDLTARLRPGLKVTSVRCQRGLVLPRGPVSVRTMLTDRTRFAGALSAGVAVSVDTWPAQHLALQVTVDGQFPVLVAVNDIGPGDSLTPSVFRIERRLASAVHSDTVSSIAGTSGHSPRVRLPAGTILRQSHLKEIPLIVKGTAVTISVTLDGVHVTAQGIIREDGFMGRTVAVLSTNSQRLIRARVVGPRRVTVDL